MSKKNYSFYIIKNITTGQRRITSFHNSNGNAKPRSKEWILDSDCLTTFTTSSKSEYLKVKQHLIQKYLQTVHKS